MIVKSANARFRRLRSGCRPAKRAALACVALAAALAARAAVAPLPFNAKKVVYQGWDTSASSAEDVYRVRDKFAATGIDGLVISVNGQLPNGRGFLGRIVISPRAWSEADFAHIVPKLKEMTALKGLRESYFNVYWASKPRLGWDDDAGWERFANNMRVACRVAKAGGLRGCFIDHEDYTGKPLFLWRAKDDPPYDETIRLARRRGAQIFAAMAEAYPEGRMMMDRGLLQRGHEVRSHNMAESVRACGDLWYAFMNGGLAALPPGVRFCDGNESSYDAVTADDYRALYFQCDREAVELLDPPLRAKYRGCLEMCFAKFLNDALRPTFPRAAFEEGLFGAGYLTDEIYWLHGEKYSIVDWGRKLRSDIVNTTWTEKIPDLPKLLRVSVGDYAELRARAAKGELTNLVANASCDARRGQAFPDPFDIYAKDKTAFGCDPADGCTRPGCLVKTGPGNVTFGADGVVRRGDRFYVSVAAKGTLPVVDVVWRTSKKPARWHWDVGHQILVRPSETRADGWKRYEVCLLAPDGVDGIGFVLGGAATPENPVRYDDISIFRW